MYYYINRNTKSMLKASDNYSKPGDNILVGEYESKEEFINELVFKISYMADENRALSTDLGLLFKEEYVHFGILTETELLYHRFVDQHDLQTKLEKQFRKKNLS